MLKHGIAILKGKRYDVYEQSVDSFYRLDICEEGANFHLDEYKILFSIVKKKGTFFYGDRSLYELYTGVMDAARQINVKERVEHSWKLSKYYTERVRETKDGSFIEKTQQVDGKLDSYYICLNGDSILMRVVMDYSNGKLTPTNFSEYTFIELVDATQSSNATYNSLPELRVKHDIEHLYKNDFVVATDEEIAKERLKRWLDSDSDMKGIDTETTGTDVDMYGKDRMVGVILSYKYGEATYFPFRHKMFDNLTEEFLQDELMPAIAKEQWRLVAHNKKFERKVFMHEGWDIKIKYDTLPLSCLVNPVLSKGSHELKTLMLKDSGLKYLELTDIFKNSKLIDFTVLPIEIVRLYACPDASSLLRLYPSLWKQLPVESQYIAYVEYELADIKADQEYYGLRVDVQKFMENLDNCDYMLDKLLKNFRRLTGVDGNINSTSVLTDLIYGKLECPVLVRTKKTGSPSTGKASIEKLAEQKLTDNIAPRFTEDITDKNGTVILSAEKLNSVKYPALLLLEKYRTYSKLRTSFYNRFENEGNNGRIFFWINQNGTESGRQSSPMHQLPPDLKDIILSDSPDHSMWDPDYSQIEIREVAFLAGETSLIELCKDPENDIHRAIGSLINNKEMWEISDAERSSGKKRNFGVIYEISKWGLAAQQAGAGYNGEDVEKAGKSLDEFFHRFKRISKYIHMNGERVKRTGKISTYYMRYRYFPQVFDPNITNRDMRSIIRKANNLPVQGTAADYMKLAEINIGRYIHNKGWDVRMPNGFPRVRDALSIHDEIIIMADNTIPYEEIMLMMRECMEMAIKGAPPFFCEPALVDTWKQHNDSSLSMPVKLRDKLIEDYQTSHVSKLNKGNYRQTINDYRDNQLREYMTELISEYGSDADEVANHVRHPYLTHELIKRYRAPEEMKLSHVESIFYAVEKYIGNEPSARDIKRYRCDVQDDTPLINYDSNGETVYEEDYMCEEEVILDEQEEDLTDRYLAKNLVWEFQDALFVDISDLPEPVANLVIKKVWESKDDNGFFKVMFIHGNDILDSKFRVEEVDRIALEEYIKEVNK